MPLYTTDETPFQIGKAQVFREGNDVAMLLRRISLGSHARRRRISQARRSAPVINSPSIKPFDVETITDAARKCGAIVTAEEHQVHAGLGGAVAEVTAKNAPVPIEFVGVKDSFGGSGEPEELMVIFGLTWKEIYASALKAMERRDKGSTGYRKIKDVEHYASAS